MKGLTDFKASLTWVQKFMDKDLEYFEALTTAESQLIAADNHHFENNELF